MQNIYTYLKKIDFEKRIKKRCDIIKKAGIDKDITSCEVMTQFCFGLMQDMYSKIYDDFVKGEAEMSKTKNHTYAKKWIDKWVEANHQRLVLEEQVEILKFYLELIEKGKDVNDFPLTFKEIQCMAKEALNEVKNKEKVCKAVVPDITMAC